MTDTDLLPLADIPAFTLEIRQRLGAHWITTAQEFISLLGKPIGDTLPQRAAHAAGGPPRPGAA